MSESKVFMFNNDDPEMQGAYEKARATFKYFWREMAWERRRIVPGLDLACVKAPFSDGRRRDGKPEAEHMWIEVDFDGQRIRGVLLNAPNWIKSVKAGDVVRMPLGQITDWMYGIGGEVYGAYTVNLMRAGMGARERREHDAAWGRNFGDPHQIRIVPEPKKGSGLLGMFGGRRSAEIGEHPMSENMAAPLKAQLATNPGMLTAKDKRGWTMLHDLALAGSAACVKVMLEHGADANALTNKGMTPMALAGTLGWEKVVSLLGAAGGK